MSTFAPVQPIDPLYTLENAAIRLGGVATSTVRCWVDHGKLRRTRVGRRVMVTESAIQQFLADQNSDPAESVAKVA